MQNQVSELALCKEGEGTHGWIFLGIVEPVGLTCSAISVVRPNSLYGYVIQQIFVNYLLCVKACASAKDSSIRIQQGNKPQYCVCLNRGTCKGLWNYRGMKVRFPGGDT